MQIFISYSRADKDFAARLVNDLAAYDVRVWLDVRSIPHGANWDIEVQKGLDDSDLMLVLLSPDSVASQNVADEWSYFIDQDKPIIPLMIRPCQVPFRLMRRQRVDFTGDYNTAFEMMLVAMGSPAKADPARSEAAAGRPQALPLKPGKPAEGTPRAQEARPARPATREVPIQTMPVMWGKRYHWFNGMTDATEGELLINARELLLMPRINPATSIPLQSITSVRLARGLDPYLTLTYYGSNGSLQSLLLMGAPARRRKQISNEIAAALKQQTGKTLE